MRSFDVCIIGTGAAGLYCAVNLPSRYKVCVICKTKAEESDSFLAQGGICMLRGESDYQSYFEDTMRAGHWENNEKTVDLMIRSSNSVIRDLLRIGVDFARDPKGRLLFTKEGAHSAPRILYHEDITGQEITSCLLELAKQKDNITLLEHTVMIDVAENDGVCGGIVVQTPEGEIDVIEADRVVLACGGIGGLYRYSTNFAHITGDAIGIALKRGIRVEHLDYVQIHPTTLYSERPGRRFLISESVRGEGALLYDVHGKRFTDELQPRDLLTDAIRKQMKKDGSDFVYEDLRPIGKEELEEHFPNICARCREEGYDVFSEPIRVVPAQHYLMGGISTDLAARTSMPGLYACGETGCNGVHGKNRLASNSLLESLVFAQRAADDIVFETNAPHADASRVDLRDYKDIPAIFRDYRDRLWKEITKEGDSPWTRSH